MTVLINFRSNNIQKAIQIVLNFKAYLNYNGNNIELYNKHRK